MTKKTGPSNVYMRNIINTLKKSKVPIWEDVAEKLENARRNRVEVNIKKIGKYANENESIVVPGVVLANGDIGKPVEVCAWKFSKNAKEKIEAAGGKAVSIKQMIKENPKGSNIRIMV